MPNVVQKKLDKKGVVFSIPQKFDSYRVKTLEGEYQYLNEIKKLITPDTVMFDIGACIGVVGLNFARVCKQVVMVEPDPAILERLKLNVSLNQFKNVAVCEAAFNTEDRPVTLYTTPINNISPTTAVRQTSTPIQVEGICLKTMVSRYGRPSLIKIDIEEDEILLVGQLEPPYPTLAIEIHPWMINDRGRKEEELTGYIQSLNYKQVWSAQRRQQRLTIWQTG